jgi:ABC-2 type transport system permease protein
MIWRLTVNELVKIFGKWRSYIGFIALAVIIPLTLWGISQSAPSFEQSIQREMRNDFILVGSVFNGLFATYMIMNFLWIHIPFLIALVAGDVVAGEGASGTLRIYLTRSASRFQVLSAKFIATAVYTALLILFFALMSLGLGSLWLGAGDLVVMDGGILILPESMAWTRFGLSFLFATAMMLVVAILCFMLSTMVNNSIGPIIGGIAIIIIGLAVSNIPIEFFETIRPYVFTHYFDLWQQPFRDPMQWDLIGNSFLVLGVYSAIFIAVSYIVFTRKDILS